TLFDYDVKRQEVSATEARMAAPGFWDNQERAQEVVARLRSLKAVSAPLEEAIASSADLEGILEMAAEDASLCGEVRAEIERIEQRLDDLELKALLDGPHDAAGAI